jgi:hypothetical protein
MQFAEVFEVSDKFGWKHMKPDCVADYSTLMPGVDADQYLALYPFMRKTDVWPNEVFFYLLLCVLFNSLWLFVKSYREVRMGSLYFMKIMSCIYLLEN